jgi:hypothetical protein
MIKRSTKKEYLENRGHRLFLTWDIHGEEPIIVEVDTKEEYNIMANIRRSEVLNKITEFHRKDKLQEV